MPTFVRLKQPLGPSYSADEDDTLLTKHLLTDIGHFDIPSYGITPWPDDPLFSGIDSFQRRKRLDVDSLMLPGGPTEKALNEALTQINGANSVLASAHNPRSRIVMKSVLNRPSAFPAAAYGAATAVVLPRKMNATSSSRPTCAAVPKSLVEIGKSTEFARKPRWNDTRHA